MELGTSKAPGRPFMGPAAIASHDKIEKIISAENEARRSRPRPWGTLGSAERGPRSREEAVEAGDEHLSGDRKE